MALSSLILLLEKKQIIFMITWELFIVNFCSILIDYYNDGKIFTH